jgi:hypothetical protein
MPTPSILLIPDRYKAAVLYSQIPDSGAVDFDVTRSTDAYRTNASGILESVASGVPRLDYPIGGGCPSLLVEPAATNLVLRSEEFDNAAWTKTNYNTSGTPPYINVATAPNGTMTADKLIPSTASTTKNFEQFLSGTAGIVYTTSVFAKADGYSFIQLTTLDPHYANFSLIDGSVFVFTGGSPAITAKTTAHPNGWWLCEITTTHAGTPAFRASVIQSLADARFPTFAGDGTSGVLFWGAQFESGSVATSYIPTVAATATRNADVITKTGVSGFIGQTEGTLYAEVDLRNTSTGRIIEIGDGTSSNRIVLRFTASTNLNSLGSAGGVNEWSLSAAVSAGILKVALAYAQNDIVLYVNGLLANSTSSANIPTVGNVYLGYTPYTSAPLNDRIRAAAIYPTRLTNSQLAALTTL